MSVTINEALQNQQVDTVGMDLNLGLIDIYSGTQPAANVAPTGTLLVSFALAADAYEAASGGSASIPSEITATGLAAGTAGYAQQRNAANTRWMYGSVSVNGGGGNVQLSTLTIEIGADVTLDISTITQPASA
jgi:hypothetical protein